MSNTFTDILGYENNVFTPKKNKVNPLIKTSKNPFVQATLNTAVTENGAETYKSTKDAIVDWFFHSAAMRNTNPSRILRYFVNAFDQDPTMALKILFYVRDIRGGQGERKVFRTCLKYLGDTEANWIAKNMALIAEYGRYDDYLVLLDTISKDSVVDFLGKQLETDLKHHLAGEVISISLLAKWMPSENASSPKTREAAKKLLQTGKFGSVKTYRKALSLLRNDLNIVENKLRLKQYAEIDYSSLPSYAMLKYRKTFYRNDTDRYCAFLEDVKNGAVDENGKTITINANTLYPYDIVRSYYTAKNTGLNLYSRPLFSNKTCDETLEAQWNALPDYVPEINGLVVCDTSGSMNGLPLCIAMSLAIYIAERNKADLWKNVVIPFSRKAQLITVTGKTLIEKLNSIWTGDCSNTNLSAVFKLILNTAASVQLAPEDMPKTLLIVSDMEFDKNQFGLPAVQAIKQEYNQSGYEMPTLVWWNVESRNDQTPVTCDMDGNILISGASPSVLETALSGNYSPMDAINKTINQPRYEQIVY